MAHHPQGCVGRDAPPATLDRGTLPRGGAGDKQHSASPAFHGPTLRLGPRTVPRTEPQYLAERSQPVAGDYGFACQITISNVGDTPAKLVSRHWVVSNSTGEEQHVRGPGVVGEQPRVAPG
ncbi:MAG: hypothetical protein DRI90_05635, partial [Deltaproteobacteria bacterium]